MTWLIVPLRWRVLVRYGQVFHFELEVAFTNRDLQGEHGIGLGKKGSLKKELGTGTIDVMRSLKRSLDPHWLLNPGKIFDPEEDS
jgi:FAD/FMN-containing dehydrogenase